MNVLKKLTLINFQKHAELQMEFAKGLNVIWGKSRTGKSCVRRAIQWVCSNSKIDSIRKEGTKKTSVTLLFDSGISIERVRSQTINRYILTVGDEVKQFDSINKEVPQEIKDLLNMSPLIIDKESLNLNIAEQISLPFLLDKPGSFRMKLFNLLTGNDLQDKLLGSFNKSILHTKKEIRFKEEDIERQKTRLERIKQENDSFQKTFDFLHLRYKEIQKLRKHLEVLKNFQKTVEVIMPDILNIKEQLRVVKTIDLLKLENININIKKFESLKALENSNLRHEKELSKVRSHFKQDCLTTGDFKRITQKIKTLTDLKSWKTELETAKTQISQLNMNLEEIDIKLQSQGREYKRLLKEIKTCPTCSNPITPECLERIDL